MKYDHTCNAILQSKSHERDLQCIGMMICRQFLRTVRANFKAIDLVNVEKNARYAIPSLHDVTSGLMTLLLKHLEHS